jgi:hypothetical protein
MGAAIGRGWLSMLLFPEEAECDRIFLDFFRGRRWGGARRGREGLRREVRGLRETQGCCGGRGPRTFASGWVLRGSRWTDLGKRKGAAVVEVDGPRGTQGCCGGRGRRTSGNARVLRWSRSTDLSQRKGVAFRDVPGPSGLLLVRALRVAGICASGGSSRVRARPNQRKAPGGIVRGRVGSTYPHHGIAVGYPVNRMHASTSAVHALMRKPPAPS